MLRSFIYAVLTVLLGHLGTTSLQIDTASAEVDLPIGTRKISRTAQLPSERTHSRLSRAHTLMGTEDYRGALDILEKISESTKSRPHEHAVVLQTLGFVLAHLEKHDEAIAAFEGALALETLPQAPTLSSIYTLAQLQLMQKKYDGAIARLREWFSYTEEPTADAFILLAMAHVEKKQHAQALPLVRRALSMSKDPKESWLQLAVAIEFSLKDYKTAAETLKILVQHFPEQKKYFKQLSGVYLTLDDHKSALAVSEIAHMQGFLTEEIELLNLANLYMLNGIPLRAAQFLKQEIATGRISSTEKSLTLLASSWHRAQELDQAIDAYVKAAETTKSGELFVTAGQLYAEKEDWKHAVEFYQKALATGNVKKSEDLELNLGIAKFHMADTNGAIKSFERALQASNTRNQAEKWLAFVKERTH